MDQGTPRQFPKSDWVIISEICQERGVDMGIIIRPEKYRDDISAMRRGIVIREAQKRGIRVRSLTSICPLSERSLYRIIAGNPESDPPEYATGQNGFGLH